MNVLLWVLQVLLAVVFIAHGLLLLMPPPEIAAQMVMSLPRSFWASVRCQDFSRYDGGDFRGNRSGVKDRQRLNPEVPDVRRVALRLVAA